MLPMLALELPLVALALATSLGMLPPLLSRLPGLSLASVAAAIGGGAVAVHGAIAVERLLDPWSTVGAMVWVPCVGGLVGLLILVLARRVDDLRGTLRVLQWALLIDLGLALTLLSCGPQMDDASRIEALGTLTLAACSMFALPWGWLLEQGPRALVVGVVVVGLGLEWGPRWSLGEASDRGSAVSASEQEIPRVLLVVVDTLRAKSISFLNPEAPRTVSIDRFAAQSIAFEDARSSASWTLPSMSSMMTGWSPLVHRTGLSSEVLDVSQLTRALPSGLPTLAERMSEAGYATAAFVNNPWLRPQFRLGRGFDTYEAFPQRHPRPPLGRLITDELRPETVVKKPAAPEIDRRGIRWLREHADEASFLWLHYFDVHQPFDPAPEYAPESDPPPGMSLRFDQSNELRGGNISYTHAQRDWVRQLYEGEIQEMDEELGRLFDAWKEMGIWDESLIILTSDHGEEFWEHGSFEHGHAFYDEVLKVPLFVKLPGQTEGLRVPGMLNTASVTPSILDLCGIEYEDQAFGVPGLFDSEGVPRQGWSESMAAGNLFFQERVVWMQGDQKFIHWRVDTDRDELYDLGVDPGEQVNLWDEAADGTRQDLRLKIEAEEAQAILDRERMELSDENGPVLDDSTLQDLRRLGYMK